MSSVAYERMQVHHHKIHGSAPKKTTEILQQKIIAAEIFNNSTT
jgi:hypothetical protein